MCACECEWYVIVKVMDFFKEVVDLVQTFYTCIFLNSILLCNHWTAIINAYLYFIVVVRLYRQLFVCNQGKYTFNTIRVDFTSVNLETSLSDIKIVMVECNNLFQTIAYRSIVGKKTFTFQVPHFVNQHGEIFSSTYNTYTP